MNWKRKKEYRVFYVRRSEGVSKHVDFYMLEDAQKFEETLRKDPDVVDIKRMKL